MRTFAVGMSRNCITRRLLTWRRTLSLLQFRPLLVFFSRSVQRTKLCLTSPALAFAPQGAFPTPAFHGFNGTAFTDPNAMHTALWRAVTCGKAVPANIEKELSNKLTRRGKPTSTLPMLVVVLDEIDQLMSQNRQVLRKLFEWADAPKSRLVSRVMFPSYARGRGHLFFGHHPAVPVFLAVSVLPCSMRNTGT